MGSPVMRTVCCWSGKLLFSTTTHDISEANLRVRTVACSSCSPVVHDGSRAAALLLAV